MPCANPKLVCFHGAFIWFRIRLFPKWLPGHTKATHIFLNVVFVLRPLTSTANLETLCISCYFV